MLNRELERYLLIIWLCGDFPHLRFIKCNLKLAQKYFIFTLGKTKNITYAKRTRPRANQVKKPLNPLNPCSNPTSLAA